MRPEESLFLGLLRDHVQRSSSTAAPLGTDWEALFRFAEEQGLSGVCYAQLKELNAKGKPVPGETLERFHEAFFSVVYTAVNQRAAMASIGEQFREAGLRFLPFKGWVIRRSWPIPELRTMGDVDILIRSVDREKSDEILLGMGYRKKVDHQAVWAYYTEDLMFELHDHMFYDPMPNGVDYCGFFDRAWDYAAPDLDESFHFLYLITHLAKHTVEKGMGFRAYLDLVFFCGACRERLRWDWIQDKLEELKLLRFTETCFALCRAWFGFESPFPIGELDPGFYDFVTNKLFRDGVFGLGNAQNEASRSAKEITRRKGPYWLRSLGLMLYRVFPPYGDLELVPWYSFLKGRPWLLPAAWVYRWYYCLRHKREKGAALLLEPIRKRDVIEQRQRIIRDWGI